MTKKFGIIGTPIKHSLSPILHNYWFKKYNIDAEYSIIDIKDSQLAKIIYKIKDKSLCGINITLPYKQKIVPYVDVLVNDAEKTSSVNTVYLDDQNLKVTEKESDEDVITWEKSGSDWIPVTQEMIYDRMNKGELPE